MSCAPLAALLAFLLVRRGRGALAEAIVVTAMGSYAGARAREPPVLSPAIAAAVDSDRRVEVDGWARGSLLVPTVWKSIRLALKFRESSGSFRKAVRES